jgi:hypothetical protein
MSTFAQLLTDIKNRIQQYNEVAPAEVEVPHDTPQYKADVLEVGGIVTDQDNKPFANGTIVIDGMQVTTGEDGVIIEVLDIPEELTEMQKMQAQISNLETALSEFTAKFEATQAAQEQQMTSHIGKSLELFHSISNGLEELNNKPAPAPIHKVDGKSVIADKKINATAAFINK